MTEKDVDPADPRPEGHYAVDRDAEWYYVDDDLAETFILGPATDAEPGDDWILTFTSAPGEVDHHADLGHSDSSATCLTQ